MVDDVKQRVASILTEGDVVQGPWGNTPPDKRGVSQETDITKDLKRAKKFWKQYKNRKRFIIHAYYWMLKLQHEGDLEYIADVLGIDFRPEWLTQNSAAGRRYREMVVRTANAVLDISRKAIDEVKQRGTDRGYAVEGIAKRINDILLEWPGKPSPMDTSSNKYKAWLFNHNGRCTQITNQLRSRNFPLGFVGALIDKYSDFVIELKKAGELNNSKLKGCHEAIVLMAELFLLDRDAAQELAHSELPFNDMALRADDVMGRELARRPAKNK